MPHTPAAALAFSAAWVGLASLATGLLLVQRRTARGPPHPFTSAFVSGLLIGISCLVVLPEALDQLPAAGWATSQVLLLFLGAAATMFFLDHTVMQHRHVVRGERLPAEGAGRARLELAEEPSAPAIDDEPPPWVRPSTVGDVETPGDAAEEADAPRVAEPPGGGDDAPLALGHEPVTWCPCHGYGGDPFAKGGGFSFNPMRRPLAGEPVCPRIAVKKPPPPSPRAVASEGDAEEGDAPAPRSSSKLLGAQPPAAESVEAGGRCDAARCQRAGATSVRVGAWMAHAMIDGMVLASAPSAYVLAATTVPVTVCALQDVAAFIVTMAGLGYRSWSSLTAAVVALSCAFPLGALASHLVIASAGSEEGVNVVRTVVAGIFTYMAVFELSPPHTHNRAANAGYLLFFMAGTAIAYLADLAEQLSARPPP